MAGTERERGFLQAVETLYGEGQKASLDTLDASVALAGWLEDEGDSYSDRVLDALVESEAVVPALWPIEVINVLAAATRRERMRSKDADEAQGLLKALPIVVEPFERAQAFEEVAELAGVHGLTAYDACYLKLARRYGIPLATLDEALRSLKVWVSGETHSAPNRAPVASAGGSNARPRYANGGEEIVSTR